MKGPDFSPLWRRFHEQGCETARTALIEAHAGLVPLTRQRVYPVVPVAIDSGDLEGEGYLALVKAVDGFDPGRGVQFKTFAIRLIRWAMVDWLRREDWAPRSVRTAQKQLARATAGLEARGMAPTREALMGELSVDGDAFDRLLGSAQVRELLSWEDVITAKGDPRPLDHRDRLIDPAPGPEETVCRAESRRLLWQEVAALPAGYPALFGAYYREGLNFKQAAVLMDRSESRAHQMHERGLEKLRQGLSP